MGITTQFNTGLPVWQDYSPYLRRFSGKNLPGCRQLNELLKSDLYSQSGQKIHFVPSEQLEDEPYEQRIFNSGRVSTRADNWHDLFNALVWARFPQIKVAINACHNHAWSEQQNGKRGPLRDALTLFDECGVILFSGNTRILQSIAERRWSDAFLHSQFAQTVGLAVCGHAMLEKYLSPYKSMTAKALLIHVNEGFMAQPREEILSTLDSWVSGEMLNGQLLTTPPSMAPLPLAGIPGWWPADEQKMADFYGDLQVFRPPAENLRPAPIYSL